MVEVSTLRRHGGAACGAALVVLVCGGCIFPYDAGKPGPAIYNGASEAVVVELTGSDITVDVAAGGSWYRDDDEDGCLGTAIVVTRQDGSTLAELDHALCAETVLEIRTDGVIRLEDYDDDARITVTPSPSTWPSPERPRQGASRSPRPVCVGCWSACQTAV